MQSYLQLISVFVFTTHIVQYLFILNQKVQASCHLLWLYSSVCVQPGWKPEKQVFLQCISVVLKISVLMLQWKSLRKILMDGLCMSHYAFTPPMSLTGPEEQTKYACLFSAVGRMSSLVFRSLHALSLG